MLDSFFKKYNFNADGKLYYGNYNGRIISVVPVGSYLKITVTFNRPLQRDQGEMCSLRLKELKGQFKLIQQAIVSNVSIEIFLYQSVDLEQNIEPILTKVVEITDQFQNCGLEVCPLCGQILTTDCPFIRIKDTVLQAHERCIVQLEGASDSAKKVMLNGKVSIGKTLLGAGVSFIAVVALTFLLGFANLFTWFGSLSGWLSIIFMNYLFKKMKIKRSNFAVITSVVTSILTLLVGIYLGSVADIYVELKENYSLGSVFLNYISILKTNVDYFKYMMIELGSGLLINGFVYFLTYKQYHMMGKNMIKRL